jgi:phosphonate transport system ATP-binding protein
MFHLTNISVAYDNEPVLHNITLHIDEGDKVVVIGQSGAGKSTLLRKLYDLQKRQAAFIHQDYALVPQLSTFHNIYMGRLDQHSVFYNALTLIRPQKREREEIAPLLDALDLTGKQNERISDLSGGQQQRVAVGRALYRKAKIILGDEPVSAIDPQQSDTVLNLLKQHAGTLVLAMHDVELALRHFDRVVGLRNGRIAYNLPRDQVTDNHLSELFSRA